jgi:membrane protein insertase Oxa1/YidC/SpoIIIJ
MFKPSVIPFREQMAIRLTSVIGTWSWILLELIFISSWFYFGMKKEYMDLTLSVLTLILDNIILMASIQQTKTSTEIQEYQVKLGEGQLALLKEEEDVHKVLIQKQDQILEKLNEIDIKNNRK